MRLSALDVEEVPKKEEVGVMDKTAIILLEQLENPKKSKSANS